MEGCLVNTYPEMLQLLGDGVELIGAWVLLHILPSSSLNCKLQVVVVFRILGLQATHFHEDRIPYLFKWMMFSPLKPPECPGISH